MLGVSLRNPALGSGHQRWPDLATWSVNWMHMPFDKTDLMLRHLIILYLATLLLFVLSALCVPFFSWVFSLLVGNLYHIVLFLSYYLKSVTLYNKTLIISSHVEFISINLYINLWLQYLLCILMWKARGSFLDVDRWQYNFRLRNQLLHFLHFIYKINTIIIFS